MWTTPLLSHPVATSRDSSSSNATLAFLPKNLPSLHPTSSLLLLWIQFAGSFLSSLDTSPWPVRLVSGQIRTRVFQLPTALFHMCCSIDNKKLRYKDQSLCLKSSNTYCGSGPMPGGMTSKELESRRWPEGGHFPTQRQGSPPL